MSLGPLIEAPELPEDLRLRGRNGQGAAGSCYLVTDITDQALALKIVSEKWEERELESIRVFRKIPSHPALAQIFSSGKLPDGRFYYTMELADNAGSEGNYQADTLAYRIKNRILPLPEILRILSATASGAEHLHRHGLFHGDIKPENIIFVNGSPKLADFGTLSGGRSGTAGFVPEDPVSGVDRDCYALGMTLYCAWSGRDASDFPDPPETYDPDEWKRVRKIYLRACSPAARRRFDSASALIVALEAAASPRRLSPGKIRLTAWAALFFLVLLAALAFLFFRTRKDPQPGPAVLPAKEPDASSAALPAKEPDASSAVLPGADPDASLSEEEQEARSVSKLSEYRRRDAAEWIMKHPDEVREMAGYGVTVALNSEGRLELRDPEYRENNGVFLIDSSWYGSLRGKEYREVKRFLREHPSGNFLIVKPRQRQKRKKTFRKTVL